MFGCFWALLVLGLFSDFGCALFSLRLDGLIVWIVFLVSRL